MEPNTEKNQQAEAQETAQETAKTAEATAAEETTATESAEQPETAAAEAESTTEEDQHMKKKELKAALEKAEAALADHKDQHLRLMAEYQNYRNRTTEEKKKIYEAHDAAMWEKYGRGIHAHEDVETGKELSAKLFMSDKKRPAWDLDYMMEIGFSKVFALPDISEISRTSMERELNKLTPQFLVGGEK